ENRILAPFGTESEAGAVAGMAELIRETTVTHFQPSFRVNLDLNDVGSISSVVKGVETMSTPPPILPVPQLQGASEKTTVSSVPSWHLDRVKTDLVFALIDQYGRVPSR